MLELMTALEYVRKYLDDILSTTKGDLHIIFDHIRGRDRRARNAGFPILIQSDIAVKAQSQLKGDW
jgi:hypothetical protein